MKTSKQNENTNYINYVKCISPNTNEKRSLFRAFLIGGLICSIGQAIKILLKIFFSDLPEEQLSGFLSMILIFLGAFLTGLGVYDRIGKFAGGGSIVPITGFANSVVSPAIEFKTEGFIYGTASKMFVVAGPIIVYGVCSSVLVGLIYYFIYMVI